MIPMPDVQFGCKMLWLQKYKINKSVGCRISSVEIRPDSSMLFMQGIRIKGKTGYFPHITAFSRLDECLR